DGGQFVLSLVAHPAKPSTLVAAVALSSGPGTPSLYRTTDGGSTWSLLRDSPLGPYVAAFDLSNPDVLYVGASPLGFTSGAGSAVYKSSDAGNTWTKLAGAAPALSTFAVTAGGGSVYVTTTTGLMVSGDGGGTWKTAPVGGFAAGNVAVDPAHPQTVY